MTPKVRLRSITQKKAGAPNPPVCGIVRLTNLNMRPLATLRWSGLVLRLRHWIFTTKKICRKTFCAFHARAGFWSFSANHFRTGGGNT